MSDPLYQPHRVTGTLAWATLVNGFSTIQFGFHLAATNAPATIISCSKHVEPPFTHPGSSIWDKWNREQCIPMTLNDIALMSTMFTIGGLMSSVVAGSPQVTFAFGRKRISKFCAVLYFASSIMMCLANSKWTFLMGRFIGGFASGVIIVVAPIMINELAPVNHRGLMGSLLQFGVALGVLFGQLPALKWNNDRQWRWIFAVGGLLAVTQLLLLLTTVESPKWMIMHRGDVSNAKKILHRLRSEASAVDHEIQHWRELKIGISNKAFLDEETPLMDSEEEVITYTALAPQKSRRGSIDPSPISFYEYATSKKYRKEMIAVAMIMTGQQLCGINVITFYGVNILEKIVPKGTNVLYIAVSLAVCDVVAMLTVSPFIDKFGRKTLLNLSLGVMGVSAALMSIFMIYDLGLMTALACYVYVIGFTLGLGQIPALMISELSNQHTVGIAQSFGTMLNWGANVLVAYSFPHMQSVFKNWDFMVFFVICVLFIGGVCVSVPETRGRFDYNDVWFGSK